MIWKDRSERFGIKENERVVRFVKNHSRQLVDGWKVSDKRCQKKEVKNILVKELKWRFELISEETTW